MDEHLVRRDRRRHAVGGQARPDGEHKVGLTKETVPGAAHHARPAAQGQPVLLREGALAGHCGHHRHLQQLGQLNQLLGSVGIENTLAGIYYWVRRLYQRLRRRQHGLGIDTRDRRLDRPVAFEYRRIYLFCGDIGRYLDHHRPRPPHAQAGEGAAHRFGHPARRVHLLDRLGNRGVAAYRAEVRVHAVPRPGMAQWQKQHRHGVGVCSGDAGEGVLGARPILHREYPGRPAVFDPGVPVGDAHADPLLAADDRPYADLGRRLDDRGGGVGAEVLDTLAFQDVGYNIDRSHG